MGALRLSWKAESYLKQDHKCVCIVPISYGSKNRILTVSLLDQLEDFQGDIGGRMLNFTLFILP